MPTLPSFLSVKEAAARLQVSDRTIRVMLARGEFPHARKMTGAPKSPWKIPLMDVEKILEPQTH